jgi:chromosome segregation ATPase
MGQVKLAVVTLALLGLGGCAVDKAGCDPAAVKNAGIFTKVSCDFSGSYQARADDKKTELDEVTRQRDLLQESVKQLDNENRRLNEGIVLKRAERDRLTRSLNSTLGAIAQENTKNKAMMSQIDKAKAEVERLNNLPDNANPAVIQKQIKAVQAEIANLNKQVGAPTF